MDIYFAVMNFVLSGAIVFFANKKQAVKITAFWLNIVLKIN